MPTAGKDIIGLWLIVLAAVNLSQAASSDCKNPPLDISIVIDQTKSVGADNYDAMLDSVMALISQYDVGEDKTHFSIVTYAKDAQVRVSFDDPKYQNKAALRALIEEMKEKDKLGNPTRTDNALKVVGEDVFNEKNGDRPESPNVMIIFTDGGTHKSSEPYSAVLPTLEEKGIQRVAVGIGKKIKQAELITIAGDENRVVNAKNFEDLNNQLDDIREATCNIDGGYTEWSEWSECTATCGGGSRSHSRTCTNPSPKNKGKTCIEQDLGPNMESEECNTQDCRPTPLPSPPKPCKEHLDVGVIVDSSNSISSVDYNRARDYLVRLAQRLEVSEAGTHMAILLYSWEAHLWHRFTDPQNIDALTAKARSLPHIRGGTRTDRALELAAEEFFGWDNSGDRPDKPNVLLVLTDGDTNEGSKPFSQVIPPLDDASVRRIAVGIGSGIDISELQQIASANHDVLQVYGYQQLIPKLESIMTKACEDQYPGDCGEWGSYGGCSRNCGGGAQVRTRSCPPKSLHLTKQRKHCNTNLCPGQEPCEDLAGDCAVRAAKGDCWRTANVPSSQHLLYVGRTFPLWNTCPKSCRRCNVDTSCQDGDPYVCPWWSVADRNRWKCRYAWRQGWTQYSLANYCKKSCGKCSGGGGGGGGGGGACQDFNVYYCRIKVKWPGCGNYYVRAKCKKSCGLCSGGSGGGGGWGRR
nr:coadhesin-like [Pocillopora verrucosa]XP_058952513.1 coadhesin-like [Pocillopora verrucosa]XP_058952514.1 coadhesin-like [Pocillopora verrucosa]XP_058952515.1 coadhesin-like [Pocillopora verrucosa]XP_058952516.1 coadhesin-like [Pocillopora verrucosa]